MHVLAVGTTGSGKTTLGKLLVKEYQKSGIKTIVLDPLQDPEWGADYQTKDPADFLEKMYQSRQCALFIDESGTAIGRYAGEMQVVATQSRHLGHKAHFFTQRGAQLDRTIRDQCTTCFIFCTGRMDAKILAEEFNDDAILGASQLPRGQAFKVGRFSPAEKINVFS